MKFRCLIFILIIIFQFLSCASSPKLNKTILNGIIYNADNEPVSGAKIYINQEQQCISDIYGHFYISGLKLNHSYNLSIIKEEYEKEIFDCGGSFDCLYGHREPVRLSCVGAD